MQKIKSSILRYNFMPNDNSHKISLNQCRFFAATWQNSVLSEKIHSEKFIV
jgi:hypothetical protein